MSDLQDNVDKRVEQFIAIRDKKKAMEDEFKKLIAPLVETQNLLSGYITALLTKQGAESIKTKHGTCYLSTRYTASLADPDAFMKFVTSTGSFDLLDRKANATAVRDYTKETGALPPGCNLSAIQTVGVRRANGKTGDDD